MTRLCVSIFVHDIAQARADADAARQSGAEMVEFRVDELTAAPAVCQSGACKVNPQLGF